MNTLRLAMVALSLLGWVAGPGAEATTFGQEVDFVTQIKPLFEKHCLDCHGPEEENSFRIDVRDDALSWVDVDSIDDSDLYQVTISDDEDWVMPPPDFEHQLTDDQKELIKRWIETGADWPEGVEFVKYDPAADPAVEEPEKDSNTQPVDPADGSDEGAGGSGEEGAVDETPPKKVDPQTQLIYDAMGSLHPAAIHLPIGLLLAAGLFALLGLRGNFVMSDCAYYCLWLGVLGSIVGSATGWFFSPMENRGTVEQFSDLFNQDHKVYWHRTGALVATAFGLMLALFAASSRSRDPDEGVSWKLGTILLACAIGWVGHTGGELHYPAKHYEAIETLFDQVMEGNPAEMPENAEEPAADDSGAEDDNSQVGETSEGA